jgi:hypothetical protein
MSVMKITKEKIGVWLARQCFKLTGCPELANIVRLLPLIRQRELLVSLEPVDQIQSRLLSEGRWLVWQAQMKPAAHQ